MCQADTTTCISCTGTGGGAKFLSSGACVSSCPSGTYPVLININKYIYINK